MIDTYLRPLSKLKFLQSDTSFGMKFIFNLLVLSFLCSTVKAQNKLLITIKDKETKEVLTGATVIIKGTSKGAEADLKNTKHPKWRTNYRIFNDRLSHFRTKIQFPIEV